MKMKLILHFLLAISMLFLLTACITTENAAFSQTDLLGEFIELDDIGTETCVDCHEHYVNYFEQTGHSQSLQTLQDLMEFGVAQDFCLKCHSTEYMLTLDAEQKPTLETVRHSLTCLACHLPHDQNEGIRLRLSKDELCISCHTAGDIELGGKVRHSQMELYYGVGGIGVEPNPSPMAQIGVSCYDCHMPIAARDYIATGEKKEDHSTVAKSISSHTWNIVLEENINSCRACHTGMPLDVMVTRIGDVQDEISTRLEELEQQFKRIEETLEMLEGKANYGALKQLYDEADINFSIVKFDKSNGYHNYAYAQALLDVALEKLTEIEEAVNR